jgi:hypothetical protein
MGAWGPGIFSDDDACDIREDVRDLVADGLSSAEIERRVMDEYAPPGTEPYRTAVARIAVALRLHGYGRLDGTIRDGAIAAIDDGSAMGEWLGHREERKRLKALNEVRERLLSPQPPAKKVRKPTVYEWPWPAGEIVAYELPSGTQFVFVVRTVHKDKGGTYATIVPIWAGEEVPDSSVLLNASVLSVRPEWVATFNKKIQPGDPYWPILSEICLLALPNKTPQRFRSLGVNRVMQPRLTSGNAVHYRNFDAYIEEKFGLR